MFALNEILLLIAAISKAFMDATAHQKLTRWGAFFDPEYSWRLKYKNNDPANGPSFWGSTTFFVALTDGWHLFQSIFLTSILLVISINFNYCVGLLLIFNATGMEVLDWIYFLKKHTAVNIFLNFVIIRVYFGIVFEYFYEWLSED